MVSALVQPFVCEIVHISLEVPQLPEAKLIPVVGDEASTNETPPLLLITVHNPVSLSPGVFPFKVATLFPGQDENPSPAYACVMFCTVYVTS
jgi:hypothetical protein